jgi:dihydroorotase
MSKFLALGLSLPEVIARATWNPARQIRRPELGTLEVGAPADIAVLALRRGAFGFTDGAQERLAGAQKLECELTVRDGAVVWDLNGRAKRDWSAGRRGTIAR